MSTNTQAISDDIMQAAYDCARRIYLNVDDGGTPYMTDDDILEVAKAIHDAVMAEREDDHWQPIETAPKDWTDVLLYLPDEDDGFGARGVVKGWYSMADGGFDCWMSYDTNGGQCYPTKWMPLPAAPKAGG